MSMIGIGTVGAASCLPAAYVDQYEVTYLMWSITTGIQELEPIGHWITIQ